MDKKFVIDRSDIAKNVEVLNEKTGNARIYAVLKGNGYGMGLSPYCNILFENGIEHFAVTDISDASFLRETCPKAETLLMTPCATEDDMLIIVNDGITATVDSLDGAKKLSDIAVKKEKTVTAHIKIDTGMGRFGLHPEQFDEICQICALPNICVEGIFTHLHSAFNKDMRPSIKQFEIFTTLIKKLEENGIKIPVKHICNSTAIFRFPQMHLTAVRAGSALIGRVPLLCGNTGLVKVGKFYAKINDIRTLPKGHNIGYAALYKTKKNQKILCVSAGYADGVTVCKANDTFRFIDILRYMFNDFKLLINPTPLICKVNGKNSVSLGRVGMTSIVLDGENVNAQIGDYAEIPVNPIYLSSTVTREYI